MDTQPQDVQSIQTEQTQESKFKKGTFGKAMLWFLTIIIVIALLLFAYLYFFSPYGPTRGIEIWDIGFSNDGDPDNPASYSTTLALGESACSFLDGDSASPMTDLDFEVTYGSVEVNGFKAASVSWFLPAAFAQIDFPDDCSTLYPFSHKWDSANNAFIKPFKYIAPDEMPSSRKDAIVLTLTNESGDTHTETLTVNLVEN